jgi:hypothetical protein
MLGTFRIAGCITVLWGASLAVAGPQHWGSGYPYLVTLEQNAKGRQLVAYEAPLRAKNATWIRRWVDSNPAYKKVAGPMAVGDFWPSGVSREYLTLLVNSAGKPSIQLIEAPEMFGTTPWTWLGKTAIGTGIKQLDAADLLGQNKDQLIALTPNAIQIYEIGGTPNAPTCTLGKSLPIPPAFKVNRIACGDFWGDKQMEVALFGANEEIRFMQLKDSQLVEVCRVKARTPLGNVIAADFVKDDFDGLVGMQPTGKVEVYAAPLKPGTKKNPGPNYTGKAMSRQWLPGAGGSDLILNEKGQLETPGNILAMSSGRVFGYVTEDTTTAVRKRNGIDDRPDAEIAFVSRFPIHNLSEGAPYYGWPAKGDAYGYDIAIKNNGSKPIPAGAKLTVWFEAKQRNADVATATMAKPSQVIVIKQPIPPFNQLKPQYIKIRVEGKWPYTLIPCSPEATWKKANLEQVGERWLVCKLDAQNDRTLRNNRYEAAIHSHTFHPIFREGNLADRKPTVAGDPCSFEYLHRKLADAITCVWERSGTGDNEDVLQRTYFDGYEFGYPSEVKPEKAMLAAWKVVQDKWEGWRELDIWTGENQSWEKYGWAYSPELHESCHLFHPLGDLYGNYVSPVWEGSIRMADGSPVQMQTNLWGPDLFGSGHALIGPNACELMKRYIVGSRGAGLDSWWTVAPRQIRVKIVDRTGQPVPNAEVTFWSDSKKGSIGAGKTDSQGCWDISSIFGKLSEPDRLGIRHYNADQNGDLVNFNGFIFTVKIGDYVDEAILDSTDVNSHSRLTLLYNALRNPESYTWTFKTNYSDKAAKPDFRLAAAVKGSLVSMGVEGPRGKYALYRRWEPAYIREKIGEYDAGEGAAPISQDMAEPDSHGKGRFRAIYEVTRLTDAGESLPQRISICGLKNALGVTALKDGQLIVATNAGIANPFAVLFDGTIPDEEFFYHYRFGHTASKIVPSILYPERFYVALTNSDTKEQDYRFDIAVPDLGRGGYDVRNDLGGFDCLSYSGVGPQTLILKDPARAELLNPGDAINISETDSVRITSVKGTTVVTDRPVFKPGSEGLRFEAVRLPGAPGDRLEFRELKNARSVACLVVNGKEYVAITDTGNNRVVVWNDRTRYICSLAENGSTPCSIVTDPFQPECVWVLCQTSSGADVRKMVFDGTKLQSLSIYPVVPGATNLAIASKPGTRNMLLAVTDPVEKQVVEYEIIARPNQGGMVQSATYNKAIGVYAGGSSLTNPIDLAYVVLGGAVKLYVIDDKDRMLRLK